MSRINSELQAVAVTIIQTKSDGDYELKRKNRFCFVRQPGEVSRPAAVGRHCRPKSRLSFSTGRQYLYGLLPVFSLFLERGRSRQAERLQLEGLRRDDGKEIHR